MARECRLSKVCAQSVDLCEQLLHLLMDAVTVGVHLQQNLLFLRDHGFYGGLGEIRFNALGFHRRYSYFMVVHMQDRV